MENKELKNLELTDDQLDQASGGATNILEYYCPDCKVYFAMTMSQCPRCGKTTQITGYRFR